MANKLQTSGIACRVLNAKTDPAEAENIALAGPLGAVEVAAGEDIQIRSLQAITGDVAFLGVPNLRGTEIAVLDYGPIKGNNVSIGPPLDDLCNAEGGAAAGQTIASDDKVIGTS